MEKKDRCLLLEICLTFFLLFLVISLFREILSTYRLYLIFGLICGFCFSWFIRNKHNQIIRFAVTFGTFGVLAWIIYSILNSSLFYKDVILICIKGGVILEFILSFNACAPPFLAYIQALGIPLFMSYPIFIKDSYNEISIILTLAYFVIWLAIFRVKFYEFFNPISEKNIRRYYSISLSAIFFLIMLISSWMFFSKFPLGQFRKGGFLPAEGSGEDTGIEKEYYDLQDKAQEEITRLIPEFNSTEERYEVLALLSSLIKESPYTMEVDKAELGLISYLNKPGPGLEKKDTEELTILMRNYVDKKIALNLKRIKDNIIDILKKHPFNIKTRIYILSHVNKIQYGNSYQKISQYEKELTKNINGSSLDANVKTDIKELTRKLKEWKTYEIYRQKLNSANKDLIKETKEISNLKLRMSLAKENINLKEKLENSYLSRDKIMELKEGINNITDAEDCQGLSKDSAEFKKRTEEENIDTSQELKELLETKTYFFAKEGKEKIEDILKESALSDAQRKDFLKDIEKLESVKDLEKLFSDTKKLEAEIDKFLNQGFILKETKDNLIKEIDRLKVLLASQLEAREKELAKETFPPDPLRKWEELIEKSFLKEETKETLKKLTEELSGANTISNIENIKQGVEKELGSLSKEGMRKEAERLKETFEPILEMKRMYAIDKSLSNLRKNIEELKKMDPQVSRILDEHLRKIRNSSTEEEFKKRLDALKEYINSQELEMKEEPREARELDPWKIYIMPSHLIVPVDYSPSLKTVAIYNKIFIKELGSELEWFSSAPNVAWVDEGGVVHSLSKGRTKISARYRGKNVEGAEIIVVDKIAEGIDNEIKNYLIR